MEILKLRKPIMIDGEQVSEISYDLEGLTGNDIDMAIKNMKQKGQMVTTVELDPTYHAAVFAQAAGLALEDVQRMSAKDYNKAMTLVRDFFLDNSEESQDQAPSDK